MPILFATAKENFLLFYLPLVECCHLLIVLIFFYLSGIML